MLQSNQLKLIAIIALSLALILLFFQWSLKYKQRSYLNRKNINFSALLLVIYDLFSYLPLLKNYLKCLEQRLQITTLADGKSIKKTAISIILSAFLAILLLFTIFAYFIKSWYLWIVIMIISYFVLEMIVDMMIERIKLNLLEQLITFIDYLRNAFLEKQTIDEAYLDAIDKLNENYLYMKNQALAIHKVLSAANGEIALENYYQLAPNAYFKILAGLSYIVREHGDSYTENGSAFIKSLSHLSAEIKEDILRKKQLHLGLSSINFIAIAPIIMMQPLKHWASTSFYPLKAFYQSALGFVVEISLLMVILLAFLFLRRLQTESAFDGVGQAEPYLNSFLYDKFKPLAVFFVPNSDSSRYLKILKRQRQAHIFKPLAYHYFKKIICLMVSLSLAIMIVFVTRNITIQSVYQQPSSSDAFTSGDLSGEAYQKGMELTRKDNAILNLKSTWQEEELSQYLQTELGLFGSEKRLTMERIFKKQDLLKRAKINPFKIFIIYLFLVVAWQLPDLHLLLRRKLLRIDLDLEITRFQLVVTMLMHVETMTVDQLLTWLESFSHLFKHPLQKAMMNYDSGAILALKELKNASDKVEYQTIMNHLINSVESLSISEAFSEFEIEKQYYQDKRKLINQDIVKKKIFWGQVVGFIPLYALMIIYFMLPLIYASVSELDVYFEKLSL